MRDKYGNTINIGSNVAFYCDADAAVYKGEVIEFKLDLVCVKFAFGFNRNDRREIKTSKLVVI